MKNKIILLLLLICVLTYGQENKEIDSLGTKINDLEKKITELKKQIQSKIIENGFFLKVEKKFSFSKLILKDKQYGKVIDTIKVGETVKVIGKEIGAYKIIYNDKIGFIDDLDLKLKDDSSLKYLKYKSYGGSGSYGGTYVKGHYRKTKSGKRVYVKGHRRKN